MESVNTEFSTLRAQLRGGFLWAIIGRGLILSSGVILSMLLTRLLSPQQVGAYFLGFSIVTSLGTICLLGLKDALVKLTADSLALGEYKKIGHIFLQVFLLGALGLFVGNVFLMFLGGNWLVVKILNSSILEPFIGILGFWMWVSSIQTLIAEAFRGLQDIRWASLFGAQGAITRLIVVFLLLIIWIYERHASLEQVFYVVVYTNTFTAMLGGILLLFRWQTISSTFRSKVKPIRTESVNGLSELRQSWSLKQYLKFSWPFWITSIALLVFTQIDIWVLGMFRTEYEVALYGIITRMVLFVSIPSLLFNTVLPPFVASLYTRKEYHRLEHILRKLTRIASFMALVVFIIYVVWGKTLLNLMYGEFYEQAYYVLVILSLGKIFQVSGSAAVILMNMGGKHRDFMIITIAIGVMNVIFFFLFVPLWGIYANVWISTFTSCIGMIIYLLYVKKYMGIQISPFYFSYE